MCKCINILSVRLMCRAKLAARASNGRSTDDDRKARALKCIPGRKGEINKSKKRNY